MNKVFKWIAIVAACVLVIGVAFAGIGALLGGKLIGYAFNFGNMNIRTAEDLVEETVDLEPFDEIYVEAADPYVIIKKGNENKINYKLPKEMIPTITNEQGKLSVVQDKKKNNFDINMGYNENIYIEIVVDNDELTKLDVKASSGDVSVEDLNVEGKIKVSSGAIYIENCAEGKDLETVVSSGSLTINNSNFENLSHKQSSGDTEINTVTAKSIAIDSTSGSVTVLSVYADTIDCKLTSGEIYASEVECDSIKTKNTSGDINILNIRTDKVEADSTSGTVEYMIIGDENDYDFTLKATAGDVKAGSVEADHKFERNNGLDKSVNANTTSGDVIINFTEDN